MATKKEKVEYFGLIEEIKQDTEQVLLCQKLWVDFESSLPGRQNIGEPGKPFVSLKNDETLGLRDEQPSSE